jgi:hypothetical protein
LLTEIEQGRLRFGAEGLVPARPIHERHPSRCTRAGR